MSMQPNRILNAALGSLLVLVVAGPVHAVDGVIEINQAKVKVGGVTPTDMPLFPVTISLPGSYRLTSNLDVTEMAARKSGVNAEDTTAIEVKADNVTIDLNGFAILGPVSCFGSPVTSCSPSGSGRGIEAELLSMSGPRRTGIAVINGTVRGMGGSGIVLGDACRVEGVAATSNGGSGIGCAFGSVLTRDIATSNGGTGLGISNGTVTQSHAQSNNGLGIGGGVVTDCEARFNGTGISADTIAHCTSAGNTGDGISMSSGTASDNTITGNNVGIETPGGVSAGLIKGNLIDSNKSFGLKLGSTLWVYTDNSITQNNALMETQNSGGTPMGNNRCGTDFVCP